MSLRNGRAGLLKLLLVPVLLCGGHTKKESTVPNATVGSWSTGPEPIAYCVRQPKTLLRLPSAIAPANPGTPAAIWCRSGACGVLV